MRVEREREREREHGTGILFEEPNPTGSRPRGLIGLYMHLFKGETEHLCLCDSLRQLIHGIGGGPR